MFLVLLALFCVLLYPLFYVERLRRKNAREHARMLSQLQAAEQQLRRQKDQLNQLLSLMTGIHDLGVSPTGVVPWKELADKMVDAASALLRVDKVVLLRLNRDTLDLEGAAGRGLPPQRLESLRVRMGEGITGQAAQLCTTLVANGDKPPSGPAALPQETFLTVPYAVLPVAVKSRVSGVLAVSGSDRKKAFDDEELRAVSMLTEQGAITFENLELYENIQKFYLEMVQTLARAIDAKDEYTHGHVDRARKMARAVAQELKLPEPLIQQIEYAALLHDVGKIGINEQILRKPTQLTPEEYEEMKKHPEIGHRIIRPVTFLAPVASMVLYHQEWYNGQGYPEGLAGEEIPLGARIVATIDAWDAMTSDRPYRKALAKEVAVAELRRQAGTQFDPRVVEAFLRVVDRLGKRGEPTSQHDHPHA